jgi:hypothetical protein
VTPWDQFKSRRGRKKIIPTQGYARPNTSCRRVGIADAGIHCGTILTKDVCDALGIDPQQYGGLLKETPAPAAVPGERKGGIHDTPPEPPPPDEALPPIDEVPLPDWLSQYTTWASRIGSQTPVIFHQAAGIWLLAVAIARRLYVTAPWGVKPWPNLYMMFVVDTTYYRKTTAFKLAEDIIRQTIPHMLMPTPGSPERFQEALSGRFPSNYRELTHEQQELLSRAQAFAAQRGLFKDEVAGLFGAFNKKDYMVGLKDPSSTSCPTTSPKKVSSPSNSETYQAQLESGVKNLTCATASNPNSSLPYSGGSRSRLSSSSSDGRGGGASSATTSTPTIRPASPS